MQGKANCSSRPSRKERGKKGKHDRKGRKPYLQMGGGRKGKEASDFSIRRTGRGEQIQEKRGEKKGVR